MPTRTYMVVDPRHDHSLRIPRPDLSVKLGTPNACNDCHADKSAQWAAAAIESWYGPNRKGFQNYAEAFHAAWNDQADAAKLLAAVAADQNTPGVRARQRIDRSCPMPLARERQFGASRAVGSRSDGADRCPRYARRRAGQSDLAACFAAALRSQPRRAHQGSSLLAVVPTANQPPADREKFERAAAEFIAAQRLNADRPESRSTLGNFSRDAADLSTPRPNTRLPCGSVRNMRPRLSTSPISTALGRDVEGETVLRAAITTSPQDVALHYSLGLTLMRLKQAEAALAEFGRGRT